MTAATAWTKGVLFGLMVAVPVGPISLLCMQRTLRHGRMAGLVSGLGAATADALYGSLAALGFEALGSRLVDAGVWLRVLGGCFLAGMGVRAALARPDSAAMQTRPMSLWMQYGSTLLLTLANPMTILSYVALLAAGDAAHMGEPLIGFLTVLGVFSGSALWWLSLSAAVAVLKERLDANALQWAGRLAGALLCVWGLLVLVQVSGS